VTKSAMMCVVCGCAMIDVIVTRVMFIMDRYCIEVTVS